MTSLVYQEAPVYHPLFSVGVRAVLSLVFCVQCCVKYCLLLLAHSVAMPLSVLRCIVISLIVIVISIDGIWVTVR